MATIRVVDFWLQWGLKAFMENQRTISKGSSFLWCTNEARCEVFDLQTILLFSYMINSFSQQGFCTKPPLKVRVLRTRKR